MAVIQESTEFNIKQYNEANPIPLKFLHSDGSVTSGMSGGMKYHLYAWDYGSGFCVGYTEKEIPVAGDLLFLKKDMEEGKINDPTELKMVYHVISDSDGVITVSEHPEGQSGYTFTRNPDDDYEETIDDARDCVDITENGLLVSQKGTMLKSLNVNVERKLHCWYCAGASDGQKYIYSLSEKPLYKELYEISTSSFYLTPLSYTSGKIMNYGSDGSIRIQSSKFLQFNFMTYTRQPDYDITL